MPIDLIDSDSGLPIALVSYSLILMIVKRISQSSPEEMYREQYGECA